MCKYVQVSLVQIIVDAGGRRNWQFWSLFTTGQAQCILGAAATATAPAARYSLSVSSLSLLPFVPLSSTSSRGQRQRAGLLLFLRSLRFRVIGA